MTKLRDEIVQQVWNGLDPLNDKHAFRGRSDHQGWASNHFYLRRAVEEARPKIAVEIGVWKGESVITLAHAMQEFGINGVIIAVDTWLGAADHWYQKEWFEHLRIEGGFPTIFKTFAANIIDANVDGFIIPLPLDSLNAAVVLKHHCLRPDLIHIDGGHDYRSVTADLETWWPMLNPGGVLIGDDYHPDGIDVWPEVRASFHDFFKTKCIENIGGKCFIRKK